MGRKESNQTNKSNKKLCLYEYRWYVDCPRLISAASLLGLHCCQCTLCKVLNKEKRDGGAGIAVNMIPFIVLEIDPYLSSQIRAIYKVNEKTVEYTVL